MEYIKSKEFDFEKAFFHFTRIDNRESIETNGLQAVAGGENEAVGDRFNPAIYFSYGTEGLLEAIDVWIKWEYEKLNKQNSQGYIPPYQAIRNEIMAQIYKKIYKDFKERIYLKLDLKEGESPETADFSFEQLDLKKVSEYKNFRKAMKDYKSGKQPYKPSYPSKTMVWLYGSYSDFTTFNQDNWNRNTHIGARTIPTEKIKIIETESGRSDALSVSIETYKKYRKNIENVDLSRLDDFMEYAMEKYKNDEDFKENAVDLGRREISKENEKRYQNINHIKIKNQPTTVPSGFAPGTKKFTKSVQKEKNEKSEGFDFDNR